MDTLAFRSLLRRVRCGSLLATTAFTPIASAATDYWDGTGTTWNNVADWSTSPTATIPNPTAIPGAADTAIFNITPLITAQTLTLDVAQSISNLTINTTGSVAINAGLNGSLSVGAGGINNSASGAHSINANIILTANQTWTDTGTLHVFAVTAGANLLTMNTSGNTQFFGILSGTQGLTKSGNGLLSLSGNDTFSGPVLVNAGTFVAGSSLALGNATSISIASGAAFQPDNFSSLSIPLNLAGAGPIGNGALIAPTGSVTWAGPINATTGGTSFTVGGNGNLTLSGPIGANGSTADVTKVSTNTLTIGGTTDNFSMGLTVNAGTVILAKTSNANVHAVGGDGLFLEGGTAQLAGTGGDQIYDGAFVEIDSGSFDTNGLSETVEEVDFQGSGINNTGALLNSAAGNSTLTAEDFQLISNASVGVTQSAASLTVAGDVNGSSNLTKIGLGTLTVTGTIFLPSDNLIISAGTFISSNTIIAASVQNSGTFIYNGGTFTSRLVNSGNLVLNTDFAPANGLDNESSFTLSSGRMLTLGGLGFFNGGTFNLAGGTLLLSTNATANNTNTGNFNISSPLPLGAANLTNSGLLSLSGTLLSGTGILTNAAGGIISGSGSITAPLTNAGTISPAGGALTVPAFTNNGIVEMTSATAPLAGGAIANTGTIEGHGQINNSVTNTGTIESTSGNLIFTSAITNAANGTLRADIGTKLLMQNASFLTNAGLLSLAGGTFDNGGSPLNNTGSIIGYGIFATGGTGLTNNGGITFAGGTTTVNGNVTNAATKTINIKYQPAIFTGNLTNNAGAIINTFSTSFTVGGTFTNNGTYNSDPSSNIFQSNVISGGSITGNTGDEFVFSGGTFNNTGTFTNGGLLQSSDPITNSGTFTQSGPQNWTAGTTFTNTAGTASFNTDSGPALPPVPSPLTMSATGGLIKLNVTQHLAALTISGSGKVDMTETQLFVATTPAAMIRSYLVSSYDHGNWDMPGLTSSAIATHAGTSLGYNALASGVEVEFTWLGDANLDGMVTAADLSAISPTGATWATGDFNYDGAVNADDYTLFMLGAAESNGANISTTLPEPAGIVVLGMVAIALPRRKKTWNEKLTAAH